MARVNQIQNALITAKNKGREIKFHALYFFFDLTNLLIRFDGQERRRSAS